MKTFTHYGSVWEGSVIENKIINLSHKNKSFLKDNNHKSLENTHYG